MLTLTQPRTTALSEDDARLAGSSSRTLRQLLGDAAPPFPPATLHLGVERPDGEKAQLSLPGAALPLLLSLLQELSRGRGVALVTTDTELTTQQAADFLHVSRPYLVKLLEEGRIPFRKVGVRRRVRLQDVLRYMEETGDAASKALDEMAAENQRLGLYP
jgi:excisionase family DNA binding protein